MVIKITIKKLLIFIAMIFTTISVFAFEDCIVSTDGRLSEIRIEKNDVIDVFPLITIMNDKNTIIIHPLKEGNTKFSVLKNGKKKFVFDVTVEAEKTRIEDVEGFEILTIDSPPSTFEYDLDLPPMYNGGKN